MAFFTRKVTSRGFGSALKNEVVCALCERSALWDGVAFLNVFFPYCCSCGCCWYLHSPVIPANGICPKQPLAVFSQGDLRNFVFSNQILVFETPKYWLATKFILLIVKKKIGIWVKRKKIEDFQVVFILVFFFFHSSILPPLSSLSATTVFCLTVVIGFLISLGV